jgi:hypothetical protein
MDRRFGMWNVRSIYRTGSLKTVVREFRTCKLDLVGVQEVRWEKGGTERAEDHTFLYEEGNGDHQLETVFFINKRIMSAFRREQFISDRMLYVILRGSWCTIILNVPSSCEVKNNVKDSTSEFSRYDTNILLDDFSLKGDGIYFQTDSWEREFI